MANEVTHQNGAICSSRGYRPRVDANDDWRSMRPLIEKLYKRDRLPQSELISELAKEGFYVTLDQLKLRIRKWGLNRKITREEYLYMLKKQQVRTQQGLRTVFILRGDVVDDAKLKRAAQRFSPAIRKENDIATPPNLDCATPHTTESTPDVEVHGVEDGTTAVDINLYDTIHSGQHLNPGHEYFDDPNLTYCPMELNVLYHAPSATFPFIGEDGTNPMQQKSAGMHDLTCDLYPAAPSLNFNCAYFFAVVEPEDEIELWRLYPDLHLEDNEFSIVRSQGSDIVAFDDDDNGMSVDQRKEFNHILDLTSVFHDARAHMDRDSQIAACLDIWSLAIRKYNTCDWKEVSELQVRVVEWLPLLVPPNHQWLVSSVGLLASACGEQGRLIEAEWHHVEQTNRSRAIHGAAHLATLSSEHGLALLYMHTGRLENAHTLAQSSYEGQKAILGDTHVDTIYSMMTLGGIYLRSRQYAAAKRILLQVIKAFTTQLGRNHIFTFRACQELGSIFLNAGYPDVACRLWQKVVDRMQMTFEYDHDDLMAAMAGLARAHIKTLNFAAAKELLLIVSAIWQRKYGDGAAIQQEVLLDLATACDGLGQQEDALRYQRRAVIANGDQTHNRLNLLSRYHEGVKRLLGAGCVQEAIALETLANRVARLLDLR